MGCVRFACTITPPGGVRTSNRRFTVATDPPNTARKSTRCLWCVHSTLGGPPGRDRIRSVAFGEKEGEKTASDGGVYFRRGY